MSRPVNKHHRADEGRSLVSFDEFCHPLKQRGFGVPALESRRPGVRRGQAIAADRPAAEGLFHLVTSFYWCLVMSAAESRMILEKKLVLSSSNSQSGEPFGRTNQLARQHVLQHANRGFFTSSSLGSFVPRQLLATF